MEEFHDPVSGAILCRDGQYPDIRWRFDIRADNDFGVQSLLMDEIADQCKWIGHLQGPIHITTFAKEGTSTRNRVIEFPIVIQHFE